MQVSILIVGYKSKYLLCDCLEGLLRYTVGVEMEVLYTDCSNDGSMDMVREKFPTVSVIDNDQNLGFGRGNNFLARHARGNYLLLLNPDTLIRDNAVGELLACAEAYPEGGAWGGVTELPDGSVDPSCRQTGPGMRYSIMHLLGLAKLTAGGLPGGADEPADVATLSGAFMLVRRDVWEQLGGFDESFFMYSEEVDLCYRIKQVGHRVVMTPRARIVHLVGSGGKHSPSRMLALTRGSVHFNRKHFGKFYTRTDIALRWLHSLTRYVAGLIAMPIIGAKRAAILRRRHLPIVARPSQWTKGWS